MQKQMIRAFELKSLSEFQKSRDKQIALNQKLTYNTDEPSHDNNIDTHTRMIIIRSMVKHAVSILLVSSI
jgi:hypothetical protein